MVLFLLFCLTPGELTSISLWFIGPHIAACPLRATWQTKVNQVGMFVIETSILALLFDILS
jgi:hypothetical protein